MTNPYGGPPSGPQPQQPYGQQPGGYGPPSGPMPQQPMGQPNPYAPQPGMGGAPPNNNIGWGIGGLLLCLPFGIPSLIKATSVQNLWAQGQYAEAQAAADEAKKWGKIAVFCGIGWIVLWIVFLIIYFVIIAAAVSSYSSY